MEDSVSTEGREYDDHIYDEFLSSGKVKMLADSSNKEYTFYDLENMYYCYIDLDDDDIHELIIHHASKNITCIYKYREGKVVPVVGSGCLSGWYQFDTDREVKILCMEDERFGRTKYFYYDGNKVKQILEKCNIDEINEKMQYYQITYNQYTGEQQEETELTEQEFQTLLGDLTVGAIYCSFDNNGMHCLRDDYKDAKIDMEQLSDHEKKRIEAARVVDENFDQYNGEISIKYLYVDLDGDDLEELCTAIGNYHVSPALIYKIVDGEWKYMGKFGEFGAFSYVRGENFISSSFGGQGAFVSVTLRLTEEGFERVSACRSIFRGDDEREYYKDIDVGDVSKGFTGGFIVNNEEQQCTKEEYDEYNDVIYTGNHENKTIVCCDIMEELYE